MTKNYDYLNCAGCIGLSRDRDGLKEKLDEKNQAINSLWYSHIEKEDHEAQENAVPGGTGTADCSVGADCYGAFHKQWFEVRDEIPDTASLYTVAKTFWEWAWKESRKHDSPNGESEVSE